MITQWDCAFQDGSYPCGYKVEGKLPDCELCRRIYREAVKKERERIYKELRLILNTNDSHSWLKDKIWQALSGEG